MSAKPRTPERPHKHKRVAPLRERGEERAERTKRGESATSERESPAKTRNEEKARNEPNGVTSEAGGERDEARPIFRLARSFLREARNEPNEKTRARRNRESEANERAATERAKRTSHAAHLLGYKSPYVHYLD